MYSWTTEGGVLWTAGQQGGHVDHWTKEGEGSCGQLDNRGGGVMCTTGQ